jgi:LysM repeat protein
MRSSPPPERRNPGGKQGFPLSGEGSLAYHRGVAVSRAPGDPSQRISWASRLLAPLALIAVLLAIGIIVVTNSSDSDKAGDSGARVSEEEKGDGDGAENPRTYVVEEGDTLSGVAAKFDVSVKRLERLNPDVDPQALGTGQELTIR